MLITKEDFEENFINNFSKEYQDYIIDFCNTFQKTFPGILDKEVLIERISTIKSIKQVKQLSPGEGGRTEYSMSGENDIKYLENLSKEDERNVIYHELLHVLSRHSEEYRNDTAGLTIEGPRQYEDNPDDLYLENAMLDEIMNEFYAVKLLETERKLEEKAYTHTEPNYRLHQTKDEFRYFGNGYIKQVLLAELLDNIFGKDLLKAKLLKGKEFREFFNEKYKDLDIDIPQGEDIPPDVDVPPTQAITPYERFQFQIGLSGIYKPYETVIDIWKTNEKENLKENNFNLYEYLKKTKELMSFLPMREDKGVYRYDRGNVGVPPNIFYKLQQMDSEFICEYINKDIMKIQDEDMRKREMNNLLSVINILRENIQDLSEQDIQNISYGKIKEYTHNGQDCLIINTKSTDFMTFVNNSTERNNQFSAYSKFKEIDQPTESLKIELDKVLPKSDRNSRNLKYAEVVAGGVGKYSLVKLNDSYYRTTGKISEVKLSNIRSLENLTNSFNETTIDTELYELISETTITDFREMSQNIRNMEKTTEQSKALDSEHSK